MKRTIPRTPSRSLATIAVATMFGACVDAPLAPPREPTVSAHLEAAPNADINATIATLRRVTARYHDVNVATAEGFVLLHDCETRPGEGPAGVLYVHLGRLMDGVIDPTTPDALLYEPGTNGHSKLVGVELAIPYPLWSAQAPPQFLGATFQREDEFGVYALHAWVWRHNPEGMFAEANPKVSCEA